MKTTAITKSVTLADLVKQTMQTQCNQSSTGQLLTETETLSASTPPPPVTDPLGEASDISIHTHRAPERKRNSRDKKVNYVADFETTTDPSDCRVWGWGILGISENWKDLSLEDVQVGLTLDDFIEEIYDSNSTIYFHNLRFDGRFILDWLLKNGFRYSAAGFGKQERGTFKTLISDMGQFYSITIKYGNGCVTEFRDSVKKLPMTVKRIAESWGFDEQKGDIDYDKPRPPGYQPTDSEWDYLRRDVLIVAKALGQALSEGQGKLTVGADALAEFQYIIGRKEFLRKFPTLSIELDTQLRRAYRGGFTYADPRYQNTLTDNGMVFDVNSLYPSVMYYNSLPYGEPEFVEGFVTPTRSHPLTIFAVTFTAELKPDHIPCLQIKGNLSFVETQYQTSITEPTTLMVTNVDWDLLNDHYDVTVYAWESGWRFRAANHMFIEYIDKYMAIKANSTGGIRELAKLYLNSLYGKFATNPNVTGKYPILMNNTVKLTMGPEEQRAPVYTAAGVFITAYARDVTIRAAQANYANFAYADTDSLHLITGTVPDSLRIHKSELGAWKHEYNFDAAYYVRAKAYFERDVSGRYHNAIAGLPKEISEVMTFEDLQHGKTVRVDHGHVTRGTHPGQHVLIHGKLTPKAVPGGIVLQDTPYELKLAEGVARALAA